MKKLKIQRNLREELKRKNFKKEWKYKEFKK